MNEVVQTEDSLECAEAKGREEGRTEEKIGIAKNMLSKKIDLKIISKVTGLSEAEIKKLKS